MDAGTVTSRKGAICLQGGRELTPSCDEMDRAVLERCSGTVVVLAGAARPGTDYSSASARTVAHYHRLGVTVDVIPDPRDDHPAALAALGDGIGLVVLGIAMLRGFEPTVSLPKLQLDANRRELGSMFLYGISYAVASLSCTIPIFIGIVSTTLERSSFGAGVATFLAYGLGMGMTLAILTIAVALARAGIVTRFRRILPYINRISGGLLIVAGAFVGYYAWVEIQELSSGSSSPVVDFSRDLQSAMQRWVERVGGTRLALAALVVIFAAVAITWVLRTDDPDTEGVDAQG